MSVSSGPRRALSLRHALDGTFRRVPRLPQRRWAQVHDVRFLATHQQLSDKVYDKYRDKLDKKAREMGVGSVNELKRVFRENSSSSNALRHPTAPQGGFGPQSGERTSSPAATPPPSPSSPTIPNIPKPASSPLKTLSSYLDIPKTLSLPPREIETIWRLRHASSPRSLCASIPTSVYRKLEATARRHPQFILPLARETQQDGSGDCTEMGVKEKRGRGVEIHFMQWTFPAEHCATVMFTHLAEYKLRGEYAQPHTTVTHHLELAEDKGLVLLQGNVAEGRGVSVDEGRFLLMTLQKFYAAGSGGDEGEEETEAHNSKRRELLEMFSRGDRGFRVEDVVEEAEKIL